MNLVSTVRETALAQPDKIAYHFMGQDTTYGEFNGLVSKLASALAELGVQKGDHVAFLLGNTPHFLHSLYATMRLGATAIPINPIYTPDEISYIIHNSDAKVVVAIDALLPLIEQAANVFTTVQHYIICETEQSTPEKVASLPEQLKSRVSLYSQLIARGNSEFDPVPVEEDDTAIILYTSGTTGSPKGAMLTHKNLYSNAKDVAEYLGFKEGDRMVATLPVFHVFALTVVVNAPLLRGAEILLVPRFSPAEVFNMIKEKKATVFAGVPTMYNFLYQYPEGKKEDFESVRLAISGGASLPVALLHNFEEKFDVRVSEGYGLSEASPVTCFNPIESERIPGSIGTNIVNVENKVVNELGEEVPDGEVGELIVRGPNVMKGYYKMPEETEVALRDGWLYTGDLARRDENGYFYIVDRKKDLVIVGGYNVYPREVEEVLFTHEDVVEAAVIGVPDVDFGEAVHAFVVLKEGAKADIEQLTAYCAERLVKYKVPKQIEFLDELPKNTTGKILRRALSEFVTI
ncbi:fatty acid--CoA ligase family protein [Sporosarcina pasteurii]|uniref:fatty acid--CoA ligase family protein n=1 Tax=Sporosarcina pasteurii TaxID=1474 RepID=UPI0010684455|nr:fatty acid--CoA ligase family protein [Sporosarcina pasteurii]MDS9470314.1 fatty acid--CoA ligase family protein [Sporosarcina pasteurii]QBQ05972.1 fatty acid--CoA ligase family protein [Sporosarcina pasteurii]